MMCIQAALKPDNIRRMVEGGSGVEVRQVILDHVGEFTRVSVIGHCDAGRVVGEVTLPDVSILGAGCPDRYVGTMLAERLMRSIAKGSTC